jgi:hypothetical protein
MKRDKGNYNKQSAVIKDELQRTNRGCRKYTHLLLLIFVSELLLSAATCVTGQYPDTKSKDQVKSNWDSLVASVMMKVRPYNNVYEIPRKMPIGFFDQLDNSTIADWIAKGFETNTPAYDNPKRDLLFSALDIAAVITEKDEFAPLVAQWVETTRQIHRQLEKDLPQDCLVLYKMYNEGMIACVKGQGCIGIDILLHPKNNDLAPAFAQKLDLLLISHSDGDHFDQASELIPEMKKAGKPVIMIEDDKSIPFGGLLISDKTATIKWWAFRGGHLNLRFSSFFRVEIGGMSLLHSGDNTSWIDFADSEYAKGIDVFLLKPESIYVVDGERKGEIQAAMVESLSKIRPGLVIPHHLLELGHKLGAYGHDMGIRLRSQVPDGTQVQMLHWGESLLIPLKSTSDKTE